MSQPRRRSDYHSYAYLDAERDVRAFELAAEVGRVPPYVLRITPEQRAHADTLLRESIVISLHDHPTVFPQRIEECVEYNRAGRQWTGFEGLARSGMTAVVDNLMDGTCCITSEMGWKWTDVLHDLGMRLCDLAHQSDVVLTTGVAGILRAHEEGSIALIAGLEAATMIENEVDRIDILYGFGVRQMGIAYSEANTLGGGLRERRDGGLTAFGERAVERMNRVGMAIDISHSGDRTSLDVIEASRRPVIITHAGSRSVWDSPRMKPDEVIVACASRGGVIGIEAAPHTTLSLAHPAHSLESVMDHVVHCVDLVGIDHVAFGPDTLFGDHVGLHTAYAQHLSIGALQGGPFFERVEYVDGLENPGENFHNITGWLVAHGWTDDQIRALLGGNVLRVLGHIW